MDIDNAEYGWHHQTAIIKLKDEYKARAERAEAALRVVWDAAYRVTETVVNGQPPDTKARWVCCGEYWHDPHKADCRHLALERALEQARAALPQSEQEETPE